MKVKVSIPETQKEITLAQYMAYQKLLNEDQLEEDFLAQKVVEIFCRVNLAIVRAMPLNDIGVITQKVAKALNEKPKHKLTFVLNGKTFGFIPHLDQMTFGEYIDLDTFFTNEDDLHKALNVLYRPIVTSVGNMYTIEKYDPTQAKRMRSMPLDVALGAISFFFHLSEELLANTASYSQAKTKGIILAQALASRKNTVGTQVFTN